MLNPQITQITQIRNNETEGSAGCACVFRLTLNLRNLCNLRM
jgi:hypothetical protein